jgi:hypothetical protein
VSILNRLRLSAHLDDGAIAAIWADGRTSHPHFDTCTACRTRFADFSAWLETMRLDARAEANEVFSPERLAAQHAQVFRRLEAADRPARVIRFPRFAHPLTSRSSNASRWIAAAAAAGLIVGVGVGNLVDLRHSLTSAVSPVTARGPVPSTGAIREARVKTVGVNLDEAFLSDLDASISRTAVPELRALDAFTPRAGDQVR